MAPQAGAAPGEGKTRKVGWLRRLMAAVGELGFARGDRSLSQRLSSAGIRWPNAVAVFLGARTLLSFGPGLLVLATQLSGGRPLSASLWLSLLAWGLGHAGCNLWLRRRSRWRVQRITEALPDSLDLMVVCLESGLSLNATIARVGEERSALDDPLGNEFAQVSFELRGGRSREDALRALGERNGCEDLKSLAALIIQSDRLGASMAKTLRAHADLLRTKRRQRAEEAARKLPIKVLFPLATLLLPPLFLMVVGPAFIKFRDFVAMLVGR
jgi:tight adherence protein C